MPKRRDNIYWLADCRRCRDTSLSLERPYYYIFIIYFIEIRAIYCLSALLFTTTRRKVSPPRRRKFTHAPAPAATRQYWRKRCVLPPQLCHWLLSLLYYAIDWMSVAASGTRLLASVAIWGSRLRHVRPRRTSTMTRFWCRRWMVRRYCRG